MRHLKVVVLLLGSLFGLQRAASDLAITSREKSPTRINVNHWDQYGGQRWLTVEGYLAVNRAVIHDATDEVNRSKGNVYAYVPIVPEEAASQLVHAVAVIGPIPVAEANQILLKRAGKATISGEIAPDGTYNHSRLMPGERLDPQAVFVNENTQPDSGAGTWFFFFLMLGLALICALILGRNWRRWMRSRRATTGVPVASSGS